MIPRGIFYTLCGVKDDTAPLWLMQAVSHRASGGWGAVADFGETAIEVDSREGEATAEPTTDGEMYGSAGTSPS